jgi:hypothetical protein
MEPLAPFFLKQQFFTQANQWGQPMWSDLLQNQCTKPMGSDSLDIIDNL